MDDYKSTFLTIYIFIFLLGMGIAFGISYLVKDDIPERQYDKIYPYQMINKGTRAGVAKVKYKGKFGLISFPSNKQITPIKYDFIGEFVDYPYTIVHWGDSVGYIHYSGRIYKPNLK